MVKKCFYRIGKDDDDLVFYVPFNIKSNKSDGWVGMKGQDKPVHRDLVLQSWEH